MAEPLTSDIYPDNIKFRYEELNPVIQTTVTEVIPLLCDQLIRNYTSRVLHINNEDIVIYECKSAQVIAPSGRSLEIRAVFSLDSYHNPGKPGIFIGLNENRINEIAEGIDHWELAVPETPNGCEIMISVPNSATNNDVIDFLVQAQFATPAPWGDSIVRTESLYRPNLPVSKSITKVPLSFIGTLDMRVPTYVSWNQG
jgi:hypothetical protein